jgi:hypothetical protein
MFHSATVFLGPVHHPLTTCILTTPISESQLLLFCFSQYPSFTLLILYHTRCTTSRQLIHQCFYHPTLYSNVLPFLLFHTRCTNSPSLYSYVFPTPPYTRMFYLATTFSSFVFPNSSFYSLLLLNFIFRLAL